MRDHIRQREITLWRNCENYGLSLSFSDRVQKWGLFEGGCKLHVFEACVTTEKRETAVAL